MSNMFVTMICITRANKSTRKRFKMVDCGRVHSGGNIKFI